MLLFLTDDRSFGIRMANRLLSCGILTLRAAHDAGISLCAARDVGGLVSDGRDQVSSSVQICETLIDTYPELPAALILPPRVTVETRASRLIRQTDEDEIFREIQTFCTECCGWKPGLTTYALSVGKTPEQTRFLGYPLDLSPKELAILRFLFYRAPKTVGADELLSVCFPENTQRAANLAVQIHRINRRALASAGLPLIESVYGKGYRLCGGIVPPREAELT